MEVEDKEIQALKVVENPALSYEHGAGPIAVKELVDKKVDLVIASQFGYGASSILAQHNVTVVFAEAGTKVGKAVEDALKESSRK